MSNLWVPGMAAAPQEELVARLHRQIEQFARDAGVDRAFVEVELMDGARFAVDTISPEPGFGFVTIRPHGRESEGVPGELIVPVGSIRRIELDRAEENRAHLGFTLLPDSSE